MALKLDILDLQGLVDAVAAKGLLVRIWSQRHVRILPHLPETKIDWWCELEHANGHRDSDHGGTAFTALSNAFERAQGKRGPENRPMDHTVPSREAVAQKTPQQHAKDVAREMAVAKAKKKPVSLDFLD